VIELEFLGAARGVTGSKHLLTTSRARVLLDCGLFQGHRKEAFRRNQQLRIDHSRLDAVVLSHAHIDHSGALPLLYKKGYRGPIYATPATLDLCSPMLMDTAYLMKSDAEHVNRLARLGEPGVEEVEALFEADDVEGVLSSMIGLPYHRHQTIAPGIDLTFYDAGHVLGSAIVVLDIEDDGRKLRLAFTGDLGRKHLPILRSPEVPDRVDCLVTETTYGNRLHDPIELTGAALAKVVATTHARGGKVIIPSFALERAQEIIYVLKKLRDQGQTPRLPVYVDSPLTVKITDVFKLHPECYDKEAYAMLMSEDSPFEFPELRYVSSVEESMRLDSKPGSSIIISASGMCEGGRILHHLRAGIGDERNTILIVGFQAEHTLGRRLVEHRPEVRIFGIMHRREAAVEVLNGFSGHADKDGLMKFAEAVRAKGKLSRVILVHGEPEAQDAFANSLREKGFGDVIAPDEGARVRLDTSGGT
jgi:metallo-beta-lactamase family protein